MPRLEGSCHCRAVTFKVTSHTSYPYMRCYCSICRKTDGGGGYAINLMGEAASLEVKGREHLAVYQAVIDGERSPARRHFCKACGSALWVFDPRWPDLVHPFASAVDSDLPATPETEHIMLDFKPAWVEVPGEDAQNRHFREYPEQSIEDWHKSRGLWQD
jgi:hypothetical protein